MVNDPARLRPASIHDVAKLAGVSYQTVSRVLNDRPNIRETTKQRVLDAMAELSFRPNRAARMLATSRSRTIGVIAAVHGSYYGPTSIVSATEDVAREHGYSTFLANPRNVDASSLADAMERLIAEGVEGIVAVAPQTQSTEAIKSVRVPVPIALVQNQADSDSAGLSVDNALGASLAVRHLVSLGHRRIATVRGPEGWAEADGRLRGFLETLADSGLDPVAVETGDWTAEAGYLAYQRLHSLGMTAVYCANDQMALGLIHGASERGVRVPADLSVVGFDDVPEAAHYLPPLTTIRQDFEELGRRAVTVLIGRLGGEDTRFDTPVTPQLVVRASTMPPQTA
ncbi:LacI family DNA-binding transcriptional regulator [Humibacter albus]|uniref:LacI family DNA-binding transcriptional regulator n=1 Tax=Humibacter albus TaxID=427754 RepID=UPI0003B44759|nr:LacI family DNA-binding transcriptional regulator [Humibacter albus]